MDWLSVAMNNLDEAASLDESLQNSSETVSNSYFLLEDAKATIRDQLDSLDFDNERIDFIENRLNEMNQLKRKYGRTIEEILEYGATIEEEIEKLQNRETHIIKLEQEINSIQADLIIEAKNLSELREMFAKQLTRKFSKS